MNRNKVAILLAVYNGERYLRELLESLCQQTIQDWILYVHDDGSSDTTYATIQGYADRLRISFLGEEQKHLGAKDSFFYLLQHVDADYYFFCDQDDVWLPEKMEICLNKIKEMELISPDKPIISHCGLKVVDANLQVIDESFHRMQILYPEILCNVEGASVYNYIPGCSMCFNRSAKKKSFPVSPYSTMHDHWIVLNVFARDGVVLYIPQNLILYRQHQNNTVGVSKQPSSFFYHIFSKIINFNKTFKLNVLAFYQVNAVLHISFLRYIGRKIKFLVRLRKYEGRFF